MPGTLEPNAICPLCQTPLVALSDTSNTAGVTREYFHQNNEPKCQRFFANHREAANERYMLEVHNVKRHSLDRLASFVDAVVGKRLTYARLIAKVPA